MNSSYKDSKVILDLLEQLKQAPVEYPPDLLAARRADFLNKLGTTLIPVESAGGQGTVPAPQAVPMTPLMKTILSALVIGNIVLAAYIGVLVYENYDRIVDLLNPGTSYSEEAPAPPGLQGTESPATAGVQSETPAISETPSPGMTVTIQSGSGTPQGTDQDNPEIGGTPDPNKENPGLHLGQTPHGPGDPPGQDKGRDKDKDKDEDKVPKKERDETSQ